MDTINPKRFIIAKSTSTNEVRVFDTNIKKRFDEVYEDEWEWIEDTDTRLVADDRKHTIVEFQQDLSTANI